MCADIHSDTNDNSDSYTDDNSVKYGPYNCDDDSEVETLMIAILLHNTDNERWQWW